MGSGKAIDGLGGLGGAVCSVQWRLFGGRFPDIGQRDDGEDGMSQG